jgi:hypothetical protein
VCLCVCVSVCLCVCVSVCLCCVSVCLLSAVCCPSYCIQQVAISKCPRSPLPYVSLSCEGGYCDSIFRACGSDADCTNGLACNTTLLSNSVLSSWLNRLGVFDDVTMESASCGGITGIVQQLLHAVQDIQEVPRSLSSPSGLGVCLPQKAKLTDIFDMFSNETVSKLHADACAYACTAACTRRLL